MMRSMNYSETLRKVLFSKEYYFSEKMMLFAGYVGTPAFIIFYFTCSWQGYWESFTLRLCCSALCAVLMFFPRNKPFNILQKITSEVIIFLVVPVFFSYMLFKNNMNIYWYISVVWAGLTYGLFSGKGYIPLFFFPVGYILGAGIFAFETNINAVINPKYIGPLTVGWLTTILAAVCKLAVNIFSLLSIENEKMRIKAEEIEKRNKELTDRNVIISTFVRPSILSEVNQGQDPRLFKPRITNKAILICDMRGFTPLTSEMVDAEMQTEFINTYFELMIKPVFSAGGEVDKLMGDAVMAVFPDGRKALHAALEMRDKLQFYNKQLLSAGQNKINNVITISKGNTLEANIGAELKLDRTYIGAAVNVCARLESVAKFYGLDLIVTKEIIDDLPEYRDCRLIDIIKVKGYNTKFEIYEIYGHQAESVRAFKNSTKTRLYEGITNHLQEGKMRDAMQAFKEILLRMPKHNHYPYEVMDPIVEYYAYRCLYFINNPEKLKNTINIEDGYHDFGKAAIPEEWSKIPLEDMLMQMEAKK
jgi:class 3 adenylate cyclase